MAHPSSANKCSSPSLENINTFMLGVPGKIMNASDIEMLNIKPPKRILKEFSSNHEIPFKSGELTHPTQLPLTQCDSDSRELFYSGVKNTAHVFYSRIQKETEEFLHHLEKQTNSLRKSIPNEVFQNASVEEDESFIKLKYLVMIHTTCSQITNLLVNSQ